MPERTTVFIIARGHDSAGKDDESFAVAPQKEACIENAGAASSGATLVGYPGGGNHYSPDTREHGWNITACPAIQTPVKTHFQEVTMKALTVLSAIALVLFLAGCSDKVDSPVSPQQKQTATDLSKNHGVPFQTTYEAVFQIAQTSPTTAHAVGNGSGNATHVGHYTSVSSDDIQYTSLTGGIITNGIHTSYAANGDELYATFSGTFTIADGITTYTIDFIFDGGTGRFVDLYGELQIVATSDDVGQLTQEISGGGSGYIIY